MRLDLFLYTNGYTESRRKAQMLIADGGVFIGGKQILKPAYEVPEGVTPQICGDVMPYVGRGGYKLERALDAFDIHPKDYICVDIGASTGGFTDCLLQRGAAHVYAVDSGSNQLAEKLRCDSRVTVMEQFNAKNLTLADVGGLCDICVCDVSFISLTYIFEPVTSILKPYHAETGCGSFVALIKPQFEAGRDSIGKNGIVRDKKVYQRVISSLIQRAALVGLYCMSVIPSPILGGDGNHEFLAQFAHGTPEMANPLLFDKTVLNQIINA